MGWMTNVKQVAADGGETSAIILRESENVLRRGEAGTMARLGCQVAHWVSGEEAAGGGGRSKVISS